MFLSLRHDVETFSRHSANPLLLWVSAESSHNDELNNVLDRQKTVTSKKIQMVYRSSESASGR